MASPQTQKYLTKSLFQLGVSCPRKLVYASQRRRRRTETNVLLKSLSAEGRLWETYARIKRFPNGILTTTDSTIYFGNGLDSAMNVSEALLDSLAKKTQQLLFSNDNRQPIFEGVVRHGSFLVRADVLECFPNDYTKHQGSTSDGKDVGSDGSGKRGKIRLTEIKAKSFDTTSEKDPIWSARGGIKSEILPYIHDAAFQTMVLENAFPDYIVETRLLVPDKAQTNQLVGLNQLTNMLMTKLPNMASEAHDQPEQARKTILDTKEDLSTWVDITKAVQYVLDNKLEYPGGSGTASFREVAESWSQALNDANYGTLASNATLGSHCKACDFRLEGVVRDVHDTTETGTALTDKSGFHQCWTERSGLSPETFTEGSVVVDLWHGQKTKINSFVAHDKFLLSDLDFRDLGFSEEGLELDKKGHPVSRKSGDGMSRPRRQLYQANGIPSGDKFIGDQTFMESEMQDWVYPFHLIDFETATPVLPYFSNMKAFEPIAFQFSHHILYEDGRVHHASEFLNTQPGVNPSRSFAEALSVALGNCEGSVFRWGSHENTILTKVLQSFEESDPVYEQLAPLLSGSDRAMVDLQKIATLGYYVAGSDASSSVKKVLVPTMNASTSLEQLYGEPTYSSKNFTNVQWFRRDETGAVYDPYRILKDHDQSQGAVADGGAALSAYHTLLSPHVTEAEHAQLEASLRRYCELDTLAMVMIIQAWQEFFLRN